MAFQEYDKNLRPTQHRQLAKIIADHRSGATAIVQATLRLLNGLAQSKDQVPQEQLGSLAVSVLAEVIAAHPQMAVLSSLRQVISRHRKLDAEKLRETGRQFESTLLTEQQANAAAFAKLIKPRAKVVTISASGAVREALLASKGKHVRVIIAESRPKLEGRTLARSLAAKSIDTTLIVDTAMSLWTPRADLVLLGADAVTPDYLVNKIGSYALCLLAREHKVPVIVLADTLRIVGKREIPRRQINHHATEILPRTQQLTIDNRYFDFVPLKLIDKLIVGGKETTPRNLFS